MMNWQKIVTIIIGFCLFSIFVLPQVVLAQDPPPRPTPGEPSGGGALADDRGDRHHDKGVINGDITGTVIDLSTGLPGAGLTVQINNIPIKTDTSGRFSLTDIADGTYQVNLSLPREFTPAQDNMIVYISNRGKVDLTLGYYSLTPPLPIPPIQTDLPSELPQTGGKSVLERGDVLGIITIVIGIMLLIISKKFIRES